MEETEERVRVSLERPTPFSSPPHLERSKRRAPEGFTLLEVAVGIVVLTLSFSGLAVVFIASQHAFEQSVEEGVTSHACRRVIEQMRDTNFSDIAALYDGYQFQVEQVGGNGTVTIYVDEGALPAELGLSRDLNGDGDTVDTVTTDYTLLPFRIEIRWTGLTAEEVRQLHGFLSMEG